MRKRTTIAALALFMGLAACQGQGPGLEARTYELDHVRPEVAADAVGPYVYDDREGAPGRMSVFDGGITVRETPDNLAKIERVLERIDRSQPGLRLHLMVIRADGAGSDPRLEGLESTLREDLGYEGYRLLDRVRILTSEGEHFEQRVSLEGETGRIVGTAEELKTADDGGTVRIGMSLRGYPANDPESGILSTTVTVRLGQTAVLGVSSPSRDEGAILLAVRAELMDGGSGGGAG